MIENFKIFKINEKLKWWEDEDPFDQYLDNISNKVPDDFITDENFRNFLIKNNCYDQYIKNVSLVSRLKLKKLKKGDYIRCAFAWSKTPEKHKYWRQINERWIDYLSEQY